MSTGQSVSRVPCSAQSQVTKRATTLRDNTEQARSQTRRTEFHFSKNVSIKYWTDYKQSILCPGLTYLLLKIECQPPIPSNQRRMRGDTVADR